MKKIIGVSFALALFLASLFYPVYYTSRDAEPAIGLLSLLTGWMGLFAGCGACISWLANPLALIAIILFFRNKKGAVIIAPLPFLFAGSFLLCRSIMADEAGNYTDITHYGTGYWLWLGSTFILMIVIITWSAISVFTKSTIR